MTVSATTDDEVEGTLVLVFHATWNETDSTYDRIALALVEKDDLAVSFGEEETESFRPAGDRTIRRYRQGHEVGFEVGAVAATDLTGLEEVGLVDSSATDGIKPDFSTDARRIGFADSNPAAIEFGYFKDDVLDDAKGDNLDAVADSELLHRFEGVKIMLNEFDPSASPLRVAFEGMVEGENWVDYDGSG